MGKHNRDIVTRILDNVKGPLQEDACWEYTGCRDPKGYGKVTYRYNLYRCHRVMWEAYNAEPIPEGMLVRHKCDNPCCCNPNHLEIGTSQDNVDDKTRRGRGHYPGRGNKIKATY